MHDADVGKCAPGDTAGVDEGCRDDDGGAVLVVVEHRNIQLSLQFGLNLEASRRRDVLKIDAAESRCDRQRRVDHRLRALGVRHSG